MFLPCIWARYPIPTMSSRRSKPADTPVTMLATRARVRPCSARAVRASVSRLSTSCSRSSRAEMPAGTVWARRPLGPSARIIEPSMCTVTPRGMPMGCLPIRDMAFLPDVGEDFAPDPFLAGGTARDDAPRGGQHGHPHPPQHAGDRVVGHIHAAPRSGHAHQSRDHLLVGRPVLEVDAQHALLAVFQHAEVLDEPLFLEDLGQADLELGGGDVDLLVLGAAGVANAREHVADGIAVHGLPARFHDARHLALEGQLPETQAAELELPEIAARAPAQLAAVMGARHELRRARRPDHERDLGHDPTTP